MLHRGSRSRWPILTPCVMYLVLWIASISSTRGHTTFARVLQSSEVRLLTPQATRCSDLFTIDREDHHKKEYEGTLVLRPNITLRYVQLVLQFDCEVEQLRNYFGRITTADHHSFHIANMTHSLQAGSTVKIPFEVSYTSAQKPSIARIEVNGVTICPINPSPVVPTFGVPRMPTSMASSPLLPSAATVGGFVNSVAPAHPEIYSKNVTNGQTQRFNSSCQAIRAGVIVSEGRWDAVMHLVADNTIDRAVIEIVFDQPVYMLGNYFGEVATEDSVRFRIENRTFILAKDAEIELNFFIRYNQMGHTPDVLEVNFNGHNYCRQRKRRVLDEPRNDNRRVTISTSTDRAFGREESESTTKRNRELGTWPLEHNECATVLQAMPTRIKSRIIGGVESNQGEHPWHVAIYLDEQYQCGGSIVGRRWIITAAHCLTRQNTNETLEADLFRVYTGIIDISTIDDHFYRTVDEVIVHREYSPVMYTTDIGLLRLKRNITYNSFIKPVCLYNRTADISAFYGRDGKVTGWGFNRDGVISNVLNYLEVPVVPQKTCSQRNVQFNVVLAVGESFCAGHADGNSVCNGDSGGGLVFAEESRYYLRGIVSISAQRRNLLTCDPNQYSVFTDVSKFLVWIRQQIS
uniref:Peptidase S1 domain-containing protein n=1 Tax=Anopheles atroparvus TaxID=41427 RepID=A0AAG5CUK2_ANOAO